MASAAAAAPKASSPANSPKAATQLVRATRATYEAVKEAADYDRRTQVGELEVIVEAGLRALGHDDVANEHFGA